MRNDYQKLVCSNIQFLLLFVLFMVTNSCEKSVFDYRHKYVGEWNFKVIGYYWSMNPYPTGWTFHDTIYYHGEISYGDEKSELIINYQSGENVIIAINKEGVINKSDEESGQFNDKEHVTIILRSSQSMLGAGYTKTITGWK